MKAKVIGLILVAVLVLIEVYLIGSSFIEKYQNDSAIKSYCAEKCQYSPNSYLWEYAGENTTRGFTTQEECERYCAKVKQGFAYKFGNLLRAGLLDIFKTK